MSSKFLHITKTSTVPLLLLVFMLIFPVLAFSEDDAQAAAVKAKFIITFTNYIKTPNQNDIACILNSDIVETELKKLNSKVNKFKNIKNISLSQGLSDCSLIYFSRNEKSSPQELLNEIGNKPVITISDRDDFASLGGIIEMYEKDGRMSFAVNSKKAKIQGLELDSKLVELADKVL